MKKPAAAVLKDAVLKKPAAADVATILIDKATLKINGPFAEKSYICHLKPPKLVVACTISQTEKFHNVIQRVMEKIKHTENSLKNMAIAWRDELVYH